MRGYEAAQIFKRKGNYGRRCRKKKSHTAKRRTLLAIIQERGIHEYDPE